MAAASTFPHAPATTPRLPGVSIGWRAKAPRRHVPSGVPLFVGFVEAAADEPPDGWRRAVALDRWEERARAVPGPALGYLDDAVHGFFQNGGRRCWVQALPLAERPAASDVRRLLACFDIGSPLEDLSEPDLICVPDAVLSPLGDDASAVLALHRTVLAHCQRMNDRMAIFDCLPRAAGGAASPRARIAALEGLAAAQDVDLANGAVYWPWIRVARGAPDAAGAAPARHVPPCGHVAGVFARIDASAGRHRAPANEALEGAFDVDETASLDALADLADEGVNVLRVLSTRGVVIAGARTLSHRPSQQHIQARRVVHGFVRWAELGLRDLVMDANTPALWESIRQRLLGWCQQRYLEGALRGASPEQAYFVQCDAETNRPAERELGRVACNVGLAVSVPAEFIVLHLVQLADGTLQPS